MRSSVIANNYVKSSTASISARNIFAINSPAFLLRYSFLSLSIFKSRYRLDNWSYKGCFTSRRYHNIICTTRFFFYFPLRVARSSTLPGINSGLYQLYRLDGAQISTCYPQQQTKKIFLSTQFQLNIPVSYSDTIRCLQSKV